MKTSDLLKKLIALCDENPARMDSEVIIRQIDGKIQQVNNAIYQPEAEEIQLFVADC